ncbi:uncharacterized protein T551_02839 [Pneumocystis jirovecii RU7]|uniref:Dpy-30 domain-containing protein n=1 Tax=Pneumocystis jirovecii (strain RU7) TaxID=1408657 RepID=A0A0W4ZHM3_PNEJ7|nr:uncharacterized protein T551_02839 [Pneumocystis jirovecii RU7]KTW27872.1 hypothetical protein T551_02839 [Pneumocystis jirovecii RU7]
MELSLKEVQNTENKHTMEQITPDNNAIRTEPSLLVQEIPPVAISPHTTVVSSHQAPLPYYPISTSNTTSLNDIAETHAPPLKEMATATNIQSQNRIISTVPTRIYLNENVTPVLLEGMKIIAKERPPNPLQVLGEYLINKSKK